MSFWNVFVVFSLMCAGFLMWPFVVRLNKSKKALREDERIDICEDINDQHLQELEGTKDTGEISHTEFNALKVDLERTLIHDNTHARQQTDAAVTSKGSSRSIMLVASLLSPLLAFLIYQHQGAKPDWEIFESLNRLAHSQPEAYTGNAKELIGLIEKRAGEKEQNEQLLFLQATAYTAIGDHQSAVELYLDLDQRFPDQPDIMAELAQSMLNRSGGAITPEVQTLIRRTLDIDPENPSVLGLAGIDAFQRGEYEAAIAHWTIALKKLNPKSNAAIALSEGVARAQIALGGAPGSKATTTKAKNNKALDVSFSLAPEIELEGTETVFVYARAWQGSRMPLAIRRFPASLMPDTIKLDASMAMAPGKDIFSAPQLEVVVRISAAGTATPQSGDWVGSYGPVILDKQEGPVKLTVNELIP
ncbi:MAG: cytochrome c-type biogenesis protein CcmH [Flavobacteriales bacterium]|jgi:cytochrome c-type biogenesis protein CcmH